MTRAINATGILRTSTGAFLHPIGILVLVAIQWYARAQSLAARPSA